MHTLLLLVMIILFTGILTVILFQSTYTTNVIISMTVVPGRSHIFERVIDSVSRQASVVICVPRVYKKWPDKTVHIPRRIREHPNITVYQTSEDFGPATKLLGALEFVRSQSTGIDTIITVDDDVVYHRRLVSHLMTQHRSHPDTVITQQGISLVKHPFRFGNGLEYGKLGYVDCPRGYLGVLYPMSAFLSDTVFTLRHDLPDGVFHDDDAYFGIVLGAVSYPILSVTPLNSHAITIESAVNKKTTQHRVLNEMNLFQHAVKHGYLPNRHTNIN